MKKKSIPATVENWHFKVADARDFYDFFFLFETSLKQFWNIPVFAKLLEFKFRIFRLRTV